VGSAAAVDVAVAAAFVAVARAAVEVDAGVFSALSPLPPPHAASVAAISVKHAIATSPVFV
jgi:hypothetical protein